MKMRSHTFKHKNNQKGAAMITVLIVISLLTILGTGLLMFSTAALTTTMKLTGGNRAFYITDGAIEESLAEINDMVFDAEATANNHVVDAFDFENDNIFEVIEDGILDGTFLADEQWKTYLKKIRADMHSESITEEEAMAYIEIGLQCEFLKAYYGALLNSAEANLTYTLLDDDEAYYQDSSDTDAYIADSLEFESISTEALSLSKKNKLIALDLNTHVAGVPGYQGDENEDGTHEPVLEMSEITSSFDEEDGLNIILKTNGQFNQDKRALELSVTVTEPKYQYVFKSAQESVVVHNNEAADYTLLAGKDLLVSGGLTTVNGDVYAYGTYPEDKDIDSEKQIGGVHLGYKDEDDNYLNADMSDFLYESLLKKEGSLAVNGNLFTRSNIKFFSTGNDLYVSKELGANELRTDRYSTGDEMTNITVGGNMYLYEDLVLRGGGGGTDIYVGANSTDDGDLYLILSSEGNDYTLGDMSGAITIQNDITDKVSIDVNKLYVSGISYAGVSRLTTARDLSTREFFQTGESVSVENKYMKFYETSYAEDKDYDDKVGSHETIRYYYGFNEDGDPIDAAGNVTTAGYDYMESTEVGSETAETFKSGVFIMGATSGDASQGSIDVDDVDKNMIEIRSLGSEGDFVQNYAQGVILAKNASENGAVFNPDYSMDKGEYATQLKETVLNANRDNTGRDVDRLMNITATRDIHQGENLVYAYENAQIGSGVSLNEISGETRISQLIDFSVDINETDNLNNIRIVNDNPNADVYINPPGAVETDDIVLGNGTSNILTDIGGTIATKGDIFIYAPTGATIKYSGTLIAEGRIIFYGPGIKEIEHDKTRINYQIAAYSDMGKAFYRTSGRSIENVLGHIPEDNTLQSRFDIDDFSASKIFTVDDKAPVIAVIPYGETVSVSLDQPPILAGMQKNEGIKGYKIEYWRETRD